MSNENTIDSLSKEIEVLRREIKTQKSNLFQLGIVVMILVTIVYFMLTPTIYITLQQGTLLSLIVGFILLIAPIFIIAGFFIVNEFKK